MKHFFRRITAFTLAAVLMISMANGIQAVSDEPVDIEFGLNKVSEESIEGGSERKFEISILKSNKRAALLGFQYSVNQIADKEAEIEGGDVTSAFTHEEKVGDWINAEITGSLKKAEYAQNNNGFIWMNMVGIDPVEAGTKPVKAFTMTIQTKNKSLMSGWYRLRIEPAPSQNGADSIGFYDGEGDFGILSHNLKRDDPETVEIERGVYVDFEVNDIPKENCAPVFTSPELKGQTKVYPEAQDWNELTVAADFNSEGSSIVDQTTPITYQWYYATEDPATKQDPTSLEGATSIAGATGNTYKPTTGTNDTPLKVNENRWYFCVATAKLIASAGRGDVSAKSSAAHIAYNKAKLPNSVWTITDASNNVVTNPTYNGTEYTLTHSWEGGVTIADGEYDIKGVGKQKNAGDYTATVAAKAGGNYTDEESQNKEFTWTIAKADIGVSSETISAKIFANRPEKKISELINPTFAEGTVLNYNVTQYDSSKIEIIRNNDPNAAIKCQDGVEESETQVKVTISDSAKNYNEKNVTLNVEIKKSSPAIVEITPTEDNPLTYTYGDSDIPGTDNDLLNCITDVKAWVDVNNGKGDQIPDAKAGQCSIKSITAKNPANRGQVKNADTYTILVEWNGTYEDTPYSGTDTFTVVVNPATVAVPQAQTSHVYDGAPKKPFTDESGFTTTGEVSETDAGDYSVTVTPDNNHAWEGGGRDPVSIPWTIAKATDSGTKNISISKAGRELDLMTEITLPNGKKFGSFESASAPVKVEENGGDNGPLSEPARIEGSTVILKSKGELNEEQTVTYKIELTTGNYSKYTLTLTVQGRSLVTAQFADDEFNGELTFPYDAKEHKREEIENLWTPVPNPGQDDEGQTVNPDKSSAKWEYTIYDANKNRVEFFRNAGTYYVGVRYTDSNLEATTSVNNNQGSLKKLVVSPGKQLAIDDSKPLDFGTRPYDATTKVEVPETLEKLTFVNLQPDDEGKIKYEISEPAAMNPGVGTQIVTYTVTLTDPEIINNYKVETLTGTNGKIAITPYVISDQYVNVTKPETIYTISDDTNLTIPLKAPEITSPLTNQALSAAAKLVLKGQTGTVEVTLYDKNYTFTGNSNSWKSAPITLATDENIVTNAITGVYYGDTLPKPKAKISGEEVTGEWYNGVETASSATKQALAVFNNGTVYALVSVNATSRPVDEDDDDYDDGGSQSSSSFPNVSSSSGGSRPMGRPGTTGTKPAGTTNPPAPPAPPAPGGSSTEQGEKVFTDTVEHWSKDAVSFVTERNLFQGTSADKFSPDVAMNRAMLVTVLARLDGADTTGGSTWYEAGAKWAKEKGVSDGKNLMNNVTRQELATMLWRYASKPEASGNLSKFKDANGVSDWALEAMRWATQNGIITGKGNGVLAPTAHATRAEVATMIMRFVNLMNA